MSPERQMLDELISLITAIEPETSSDITFSSISGDGTTGADLESTARQMRAYEWMPGPTIPASPQRDIWQSEWSIRIRYPQRGTVGHTGDLTLLRVIEAEDARAIIMTMEGGYPPVIRRVSVLSQSRDEQEIDGEPIDIITIIFTIDYVGGACV